MSTSVKGLPEAPRLGHHPLDRMNAPPAKSDVRTRTLQDMPFGKFEARFYDDTDTIRIYLIKTVPGLMDYTDTVAPGLHVDYTVDDKVVAFDAMGVSERINCHFFDTLEPVNGLLPWVQSRDYSKQTDRLTIFFTMQSCQATEGVHWQETDDKRIMIGADANGVWDRIEIRNASDTIARFS